MGWDPTKQTVRVANRHVTLTHLDRVLWPDAGWTKADLLHYFAEMADVFLRHVAERPLTLIRCPDGVGGPCFYQKNKPDYAPEWIESCRMNSEPDETVYVLARDLPTIVWLANQNVIEFHPWLATRRAPNYPDAVVIDLDPMPPTGFEEARAVAFKVKDVLDHIGLWSLPKLSGATGIHIYIPLDGKTTFAESRAFAEWLAATISQLYPDQATDIRAVQRRGPRVYVDPLQNVIHKTIAAPYSPRARAGAPVSTPVLWEELSTVNPAQWTIKTVPDRVRRMGDLWQEVMRVRQSLPGLNGRKSAPRPSNGAGRRPLE